MPVRPALGMQERADRDGNQRQWIDALLTRQVQRLRTGEQWADMLRLAALLPGQSFSNILLIASQHPGATMVAGYEAWQALGRQVTRGQKGIAVLAESVGSAGLKEAATDGTAQAAEHGDQGRTRLTYVWDISQTTGPDGLELGISTRPDRGSDRAVLVDLTRDGLAFPQ